jgi:peptide-methionine (R)-S-oxide reductase
VLAASKAADATWDLTAEQWRQRLSPEAYDVLRNEGTERPFTSPLNAEKRSGTYHCAGCDQPLFSSEAKFDSGTGWPSFLAALAGCDCDESRFQIDHSPYGIPLQPLRWSPGPRVQ